jgi:hypothetical protein
MFLLLIFCWIPLSVVVLWYSEECGDMCASFYVLICDSNTHVRLKHEIDCRLSKTP